MTKFTAYVAWILLCESCKFGEKICYSNWDNICFLMDCFLLAHPVHFISHLTCTNVWGYKASVYQYADEILSLFTCIWKVPTELPSDAVTYRTCHHSDSSLRDKVLMPYFTFIMHTHTHTHADARTAQTDARERVKPFVNLFMQHKNPISRKWANVYDYFFLESYLCFFCILY